jgi:hypothetical protein
MALSGSKDFTVTRDDIIESALKLVGSYDAAEAVPSGELTDAAQRLNLIAKEWTVEGIQMPLREKDVLFLNSGKQRYRLGNVGTTGAQDNMHFCTALSFKENAIVTTAAVATDTLIKCTDSLWKDYEGTTATKDATADDTLSVGIRLDNGGIFWSTQSSETTDSITIADQMPSGAAIGNKIYNYLTVNRQPRPTKILYAFRQDTSGNDSQVDIVGRKEYERLSAKDSSGPVTKIHYSPRVSGFGSVADGDSAGDLYVWPAKNPANVDKLFMVCEHYIDDFDGATNHISLPIEYGNALIWNLAVELAYEYGIDRDKRREIKSTAEFKKSTILNAYDVENASFSMARELSGR